jgi:hypothetical protein
MNWFVFVGGLFVIVWFLFKILIGCAALAVNYQTKYERGVIEV